MNQKAYYKTEEGVPTVRLNIPFSDKSRSGGSNRHTKKNQETLSGLTEAIFRNKDELTHYKIFMTHRRVTHNITLEDITGNKIELPSGYFNYFNFDVPSLIFGRIISRKDYESGTFNGKSSIKIEYMDIYNKIKTVSVLISTQVLTSEAEASDIDDITDENTWITGIAYRKKYMFYYRSKYDSRTHTVYNSKPPEERTKTCVYNFIFHKF